MAVSRGLRRLKRIRDLEEGQARVALESALGELARLDYALAATGERERQGRRLVDAGVRSGELPDRLAGLEETRAAGRYAAALAPRLADAELDVAALREEFLALRVARRQVETLIEEAEVQDAIEAGRRAQQALDDWYLNRLRSRDAATKRMEFAGFQDAAQEDGGGDRQDAGET